MLEFLFGKKNSSQNDKVLRLNKIYAALKENYPAEKISEKRKNELSSLIKKYGYLPYPYVKALEELTPEEILFGLEIKWGDNKVFKNNEFIVTDDKISVLSRNNIKNSSWIQKEGHDIKLINLAGLGRGRK